MSKLPHNRPLLYLISDHQEFPPNPEITGAQARQLQIRTIHEATRIGCGLVQIREKKMTARELFEFTREVIDVARPHHAKVLVNDRLDVALASDADGIHLRVSSLPISEIQKVVARRAMKDFIIGVSTHSMAEARIAEAGGADFIVCGPVYDTPSKRAYGPPMGIEQFALICQSIKIPVLALGGITPSNFHEPLLNGAAGIAGIRLFTKDGGRWWKDECGTLKKG